MNLNSLPQTQHNDDRLRRAESWLKRSRKAGSDAELAKSPEDKAAFRCEQFIFLWIAFNAAYGNEPIGIRKAYSNPTETDKFNDFLQKILRRDPNEDIKEILLNKYSDSINKLLRNQYVFRPFWSFVRGAPNMRNWEQRFKKSKKDAQKALNSNNVQEVLREVFNRLYELRNQIFHGGVTIASGWGQTQIRDGSSIMASLTPKILEIMSADIKENPDSDIWGKVAYPRVNKSPDVYISHLKT